MYYTIFASNNKEYLGYTENKQVIKAFKKQRDMSLYVIYKYDDDIPEYVQDFINKGYMLDWYYNWPLFSHEVEYFENSLAQLSIDLMRSLVFMFRTLGVMKLPENKKRKVEKSILILVRAAKAIDYDDEYEMEDFFDIDKMMKHIIV